MEIDTRETTFNWPVSKPEYIPAWPSDSATVARLLRAWLGPLAVRIDHIGSTSVPLLADENIIEGQVRPEVLDIDQLQPRLPDAMLASSAGPASCTPIACSASGDRTKTGTSYPLVRRALEKPTCGCVLSVEPINALRLCLVTTCLPIPPRRRPRNSHVPTRATYTDTKALVFELIVVAAESVGTTDWQAAWSIPWVTRVLT